MFKLATIAKIKLTPWKKPWSSNYKKSEKFFCAFLVVFLAIDNLFLQRV